MSLRLISLWLKNNMDIKILSSSRKIGMSTLFPFTDLPAYLRYVNWQAGKI